MYVWLKSGTLHYIKEKTLLPCVGASNLSFFINILPTKNQVFDYKH